MILIITKIILVFFLWNLGLVIIEGGNNIIKETHLQENHLNISVMWGYTVLLMITMLILGGFTLIDKVDWGAI